MPAQRCDTDSTYTPALDSTDYTTVVSTQAELDTFEGCEVIEGGLRLDAYVPSFFREERPQVSLAALSRLREIRGGFNTQCGSEALASLPNLERVDNLVVSVCGGIDADPFLPPGLTVTESLEVHNVDAIGPGGLRLASEMASVQLQGTKLVNADALITLERVGRLIVEGTGFENLNALSNLRRVDEELHINDNVALSNADGLSGLESATELQIRNNPVLRTLPSFPALTRLSRLYVEDNAQLEVGPDLPALTSLPVPDEEDPPRDPAGARIANNASLRSLIGFSALTESDALYVNNNAALERIAFPQLRRVDNRLSVTSNPMLPKSELLPLGQVAAGSLDVGGNLGAERRAACPWPNDGVCDESLGLCDAGTDPDCR
jgi:hypothetical protein